MSDPTTDHDSTVSTINDSDTGRIYVPATVQRELDISIDDEVVVELSDLDHEFIESIKIENPQTAGDTVTIPASAMRTVELDDGASVTASFSLPDADDVADEVEETTDDVEEALDELEGSVSDEDADSGASTDDDTEGLGELFG